MTIRRDTHPDTPRLRIVFKDGALVFSLAAGATYADVAAALRDVTPRRHRHPLTIDVTLAA